MSDKPSRAELERNLEETFKAFGVVSVSYEHYVALAKWALVADDVLGFVADPIRRDATLLAFAKTLNKTRLAP